MTQAHNDPFEYDVALSFAGQDRAIVERLANLLIAKGEKVLYDEVKLATLVGNDLVAHLAELYRTKARYCVMFISRAYPLEKWTEAERTSAQEHALRDSNEYFLPIQLDDTEIPGILETKGYMDLRQNSVESIVNLLEEKLAQINIRSGPPPQSHDLRSGNIPSKRSTSDQS